WQDISSYSQNQALVIITPQFLANETEMSQLIEFAKRGNDVFISTKNISQTAQNYFRCDVMTSDYALPKETDAMEDSLDVKLNIPVNEESQYFFYPGYRFDSYFLKFDSLVSNQYGYATYMNGGKEFQIPHFMALKTGIGHIYLHLAPICF